MVGSSNFTASGMGFGANHDIELNLEVDSNRRRAELKQWFDEIWNNEDPPPFLKGGVKPTFPLWKPKSTASSTSFTA